MKKFNLDVEENYWVSFTDIISALFGVFILIFAISVIINKINEGEKEGLNKPIFLSSDILFEKGKADIKPAGQEMLKKEIVNLTNTNLKFKDDPNSIIFIQGFTDNDSINTFRFPSNWELSTQRAVEVVKFIEKNTGIKGERLAAGGFSKYHPRMPNTTVDNKAQNRYIKISIVEKEYFFKEDI